MSKLENIDNNAVQHDKDNNINDANNNDGPPPPPHVQPHLPHHLPSHNNNDNLQIPNNFWASPLALDETLERCIINNRAIGSFPIPHWRNLNLDPNDEREMEWERVRPTFEELRNMQGPAQQARLRPQQRQQQNATELLSSLDEEIKEQLSENDDETTAVAVEAVVEDGNGEDRIQASSK
jgi:hypothetical protein